MPVTQVTVAEYVAGLQSQLQGVLNALEERIQKTPFWDHQRKGQLLTARNTLANVVDGAFSRLAPKASAGDPEALSRIDYITGHTLEGMAYIIDELDYGRAENWEQFGAEAYDDLKNMIRDVAEAGGGAGAAFLDQLPWWFKLAVLAGAVGYAYRSFR